MNWSMPEAFLRTITADIDADTPRLVYADWLEENDQPQRAEFIRVQVQRAFLPTWDAAQVRLRLRERELLDRHGEAWLAEMPAIEGARWEGFRRGIVAEVSFASFETMRKNAHACRAVAPVEAVTVRWPRREDSANEPIAELRELVLTGQPDWEIWEWVGASPQFATLRQLTAGALTHAWLSTMMESPHLTNLKSLHLPSNDFSSYDFGSLAESKLSALEELDLSSMARNQRYNNAEELQAAGLRRLVAWPGLATVKSLNLNGNYMDRAGLRALLRSDHTIGLKHLQLRDTTLDGQAMAEFKAARRDLRLETLDIGQNVLGESGVKHLTDATCLHDLKVLRLDRCEIPQRGASLFARKAKFLDGLHVLDVSHNHFGPAGLKTLLGRTPPALHTLVMRDNDLLDEGANVLASSPASDALVEVDLSQNGLRDAAAHALGGSRYLRELLVLRLADNPISPSAMDALSDSPLGRRLSVLESEEAFSDDADDRPD